MVAGSNPAAVKGNGSPGAPVIISAVSAGAGPALIAPMAAAARNTSAGGSRTDPVIAAWPVGKAPAMAAPASVSVPLGARRCPSACDSTRAAAPLPICIVVLPELSETVIFTSICGSSSREHGVTALERQCVGGKVLDGDPVRTLRGVRPL